MSSAMLDQVAGDQQQRRLGPHRVQMVDHQVEAADVELVRIVAVEADVQVGHLRDQDAVDRRSFRQVRPPWPKAWSSARRLSSPLT